MTADLYIVAEEHQGIEWVKLMRIMPPIEQWQHPEMWQVRTCRDTPVQGPHVTVHTYDEEKPARADYRKMVKELCRRGMARELLGRDVI